MFLREYSLHHLPIKMQILSWQAETILLCTFVLQQSSNCAGDAYGENIIHSLPLDVADCCKTCCAFILNVSQFLLWPTTAHSS